MKEIIENFRQRNMELEYFTSRKALQDKLVAEVSDCETVGIGNSQTLKELNAYELLTSLGKDVYDKTYAKSSNEADDIKRKALLTDCYLSSVNAIGKDGTIVNIDHSGNRVAAITFGPRKVIIVAGLNKLVANEKEAIRRALTIATPKNARRAKIDSPCSLLQECDKCTGDLRVCNYISIIRGQAYNGRLKIYLLEDSLGY